ncbi:MAG TPA: fibronectin type III domain-containing protein [Thermoanaerobaculia bacterium]|nr:fibronectin type III domain-containing protein [Thermoanaerobaculia bacterium]
MKTLPHRAASLALPLVLALHGAPAHAQCVLQPGAAGQNGQTLGQNFLTLVDDLYAIDFHPTHSMTIGGKTLQVPPWFTTSTDCDVAHLKDGSGAINPPLASPSFSDYLVVSDELSELAVVTALADSDSRMMAIHDTIQAMASSTHPGLPCWIAEMSGGTLTCRSQDTATDATARFGLAYYHAAGNPAFPAASRAIYRAAGDSLAANHLAAEYDQGQNHCYTSSVTQQQVCDWVGGGANTAAGGVGNLEMWIGYSQDVARFLLAAYVSTNNAAYLTRAGEVVDQWLIASAFDGTHLTFGRTDFGWNTTTQPIAPRAPYTGDWYWQQGRAWDAADAPRALWMGDVLRAFDLATGHASMTGAYAVYADLSAWVQLVLGNGTQTATSSCIQYNQDGTVVSGNCGTDYYYNGLGAGLSTFDGTSLLAPKLSTALSQFGWNASPPTWSSAACFGIYRGVRPVKALAAAIGLDAATWGGTPCGGAGGTPPAAPTWLRVTTVSASELELTWQDNSNNESGFKIERKEGCCGPWTPLPDAPANSTGTATYESTGLKCGTTYAYHVWAWNAAGASAQTNEAAAATSACP